MEADNFTSRGSRAELESVETELEKVKLQFSGLMAGHGKWAPVIF
jgi:hypothetical protein